MPTRISMAGKSLLLPIDLVMRADVDWDNCVLLDDELQADSVALVDRYAAKALQVA